MTNGNPFDPSCFRIPFECARRGKKEKNSDVRRPPRGKRRMTGLFLSGLRSIAVFINNSPSAKFKIFIRTEPVAFLWIFFIS